jgi:flavodoxin
MLAFFGIINKKVWGGYFMRKLVVFYSLEGNTKYIAENIADAVGAEVLELKPVKEINSSGFMKYIWGGRQVVAGAKPELQEISIMFEDYDIIYIGTPVWAYNFNPVFNTLFSNYKIEGKKIALFCCNGGNKGKTFVNMREKLKDNTILGEIEFSEPVKNQQKKAALARKWAEDMEKEIM